MEAVAGSIVDSHLGNAISHQLAIPKIAACRAIEAQGNLGFSHRVLQPNQPIIKFIRLLKGIHGHKRTRLDTPVNQLAATNSKSP